MSLLQNKQYFETPVNNAILDPFQGFDADVWVLDQGTGQHNLVGRFTSIQLTIRNATEPYLELNQRVPRLLDGEFQFGWVLERGMLDTRVMEQTFGYSDITRELRNNRNVRFQISFSINAPELQAATGNGRTPQAGLLSPEGKAGSVNLLNGESTAGDNTNPFIARRQAIGEYMLTFCKVDSWTLGLNAGRNVIANRWEGMAEGISYVVRNESRMPDSGTFLGSIGADRALVRGVEARDQVDPFPWDAILYSRNTGQNNNNRVSSPLTTTAISPTGTVLNTTGNSRLNNPLSQNSTAN